MSKKELLYKSPNHIANLNGMRLNNKWCDLTIIVEEMKIRAHKVIIAANLKYFDVMLSNDTFQESKQDVITMASVKGADLEAFVSFAYTGEILVTDKNALSLLTTADYLGEDVIKDVCIKFLKKHLKADEACSAYKFADSINCVSLKNISKKKILSTFMTCSQSTDYLNFDYEHMTDILSGANAKPATLQQSYFEGVVKWILHDLEARKDHIDDLLNSVDITKLTTDNLVGYLYGDHLTDEYASVRDHIMSYYHTIKSQQMKKQIAITKQTLAIVGVKNEKLIFQLCNFSDKNWTSLIESPDACYDLILRAAVMNNKLYYHSGYIADGLHLSMFDPVTKQSTRLHSSKKVIRYTSSCAYDKSIYFCGGVHTRWLPNRHILKFNSETNSFENLTPMKPGTMDAAAIFYQGRLHVLGGWIYPEIAMNMVEMYNPDTNEWITFPSMYQARFGHAVAVLGDKLYACGGHQTKCVEVYDPSKNRWQLVASMNKKRKHFLVVAHEEKLWAIGGDNEATVELYDPLKNEWQMDDKLSLGLQIGNPQGGLIQLRC